MVAIADLRRSADRSLSTTSIPATAATCAIPLPIWPEPITPTLLIMEAILSSVERSRTPRLFKPYYYITIHRPVRTASSRCHRGSLRELAERLGQFGNRLIEVGNQAIIGDLEDRGVLILVDRHDHLGILHAGEMLDRPGNTDRNIELGCDHLAGLADLP